MNIIKSLILLAGLASGVSLAADPPPSTPDLVPEASPSTLVSTNSTNTVTASLPIAADTNAVPTGENPDLAAQMPEDNSTNALRLNFRGASLDMVLNYLSEAAGFIIVLETQPKGKVDVFSNQALTKDEAVNLLNSVLRKNGYAAIRNGRTLTIVNRDEAKTHDVPVILGSDPEAIPRTDEIVTQIIPVKFVEVAQLIKDLQPLVSLQTTMTANESGNSIVITDTQANIHKVAEVIKAIDSGAEDVTVVKVFRLKNADPSETSDLLTSLFPDDSRSGGSGAPVQFGGFPGRMARFFGGGGGAGGGGQAANAAGGGQNSRIKKRARVIAVADPRTSSIVVSAAKDLMDQIEKVVDDLDGSNARHQTVHVIKLQNTDAQSALPVLQDIFQKSGTQNSRNNTANQTGPLQNRSTQQLNQQNSTSGNRSGIGGGRGTGGFGQ